MVDPDRNKLKNFFTFIYHLEFWDKRSSMYQSCFLLNLNLVEQKVMRIIRKHPAIVWETDWVYDANDDRKSLYGSIDGNEFTITVARERLHHAEEEKAI